MRLNDWVLSVLRLPAALYFSFSQWPSQTILVVLCVLKDFGIRSENVCTKWIPPAVLRIAGTTGVSCSAAIPVQIYAV